MSNAFDTYRANRTKRLANRRNARRVAKVCAFVGDGLALVATVALVVALYLLAQGLAAERDTYALVVIDGGSEWVMDYALTYSDCRNELGYYKLGVAYCDKAKG